MPLETTAGLVFNSEERRVLVKRKRKTRKREAATAIYISRGPRHEQQAIQGLWITSCRASEKRWPKRVSLLTSHLAICRKFQLYKIECYNKHLKTQKHKKSWVTCGIPSKSEIYSAFFVSGSFCVILHKLGMTGFVVWNRCLGMIADNHFLCSRTVLRGLWAFLVHFHVYGFSCDDCCCKSLFYFGLSWFLSYNLYFPWLPENPTKTLNC